MTPGDEVEISDLVFRSFLEFIAPRYTRRAAQVFLKNIQPGFIMERSQNNHFILTAFEQKIVGMIEVRDHRHISMLFVDKVFHQQGIAKELFNRALAISRMKNSTLREFSVNSSQYAIPFYLKLGFSQICSEQIEKGVRFTPMRFPCEAEIRSQ